jgi:NarL family two-component system response regulator LiaR
MSERIRILIADDHPIVCRGLSSLLNAQPEMVVVGEARDGVAAVSKTLALQPDVILMDLVMPRKDGIEAIREIKQAGSEARILVLTSFAEDEQILHAVRAGALGYLLKDTEPERLLQAIRAVYRGEWSLNQKVMSKLVQEVTQPADLQATPEETLTAREVDVLKLIAQGLSNQQIAQRLSVTEPTVGAHVSRILQKLQVENRTQAALYALRTGLADLEPPAPG